MAQLVPQRGPEVLAEQTPGLSPLSLCDNPISDPAALKPNPNTGGGAGRPLGVGGLILRALRSAPPFRRSRMASRAWSCLTARLASSCSQKVYVPQEEDDEEEERDEGVVGRFRMEPCGLLEQGLHPESRGEPLKATRQA